MDISTLCIHGSKKKFDSTGAVSMPIFQSATFAHPNVGESTGYDYSRLQNPTREHLEDIVTQLEEGIDTMAFSSGMAAVTTMMELFSPGDHIIASDDLYGGTQRLFSCVSKKNGLDIDLVNTSYLDKVRALARPETKAIFIETPSNPLMQVTDIAATAAFAKQIGALLVVDNTFLTPYYQKPLHLGADIVIHSGTKYLGGHNDTLAGFVTVKDAKVSEKLRYIYKTTGACLSPFDSWLLIRGIKTLAVRMERQCQTAGILANWLTKEPKIKKVHYVGLPEHPNYEISKKQTTGFGAMISLETDTEATAVKLLERVQIIQYAESLGGTESLVTYPMLQTHADVPKEIREAKGIHERMLRLSIGLEGANDLIADLAQGFAD